MTSAFSVIAQYRPFHLVAPEFVEVSEPTVGVVTGLARSGIRPQAPFVGVELEVCDAGDAVVAAGLESEDGDHVLAVYDPRRRRVGIQVRRGGETLLLREKRANLAGGHRFAFVVCENRVTVLADQGNGWRPLLTERRRVAELLDLGAPEVLGRYHYSWGVLPAQGASAELGTLRAGLFGMVGVRDPHVVQHSDGTPYVRDGMLYFTMTCAGLGFFQQAHWGVFTLDLADPGDLRQVAQLFSYRDGRVLGDHAGQLVRDDENDRWIVLISSWGDLGADGVHVRHVDTTDDLLHGVHLLRTERTPLPTTLSAWDPGLTRIDGRWHLSFVESPSQEPFAFHPALAVAEGPDWCDGLVMVGAATEMKQCEGPILARVDGTWRLLASDGAARVYPIFDLEMRRVGELDAPYPSNIPHSQVVPLPEGGELLVTFDGTQYAESVMGYGGHGDVVIMRRDLGGNGPAGLPRTR